MGASALSKNALYNLTANLALSLTDSRALWHKQKHLIRCWLTNATGHESPEFWSSMFLTRFLRSESVDVGFTKKVDAPTTLNLLLPNPWKKVLMENQLHHL